MVLEVACLEKKSLLRQRICGCLLATFITQVVSWTRTLKTIEHSDSLRISRTSTFWSSISPVSGIMDS
jgi:hypothetical protein